MSQSTHSLPLLLGAAALLVLGYFVFIQGNDFELSPDAVSPLSDQVLAKTQAFIAHRNTLDSVNISPVLFSDSRFTSLRSFTPNLVERPVGKDDLFAPLPGQEVAAE
ncbi:MAG: hypothetical protein RLZZ70_556 [Candidatus Parcubacteria bacterium]|jgi:hypothetical protein